MIIPQPVGTVSTCSGADTTLTEHTFNIPQFFSKITIIKVRAALAVPVNGILIKKLRSPQGIKLRHPVHLKVSQCPYKPVGIYRTATDIYYLPVQDIPD